MRGTMNILKGYAEEGVIPLIHDPLFSTPPIAFEYFERSLPYHALFWGITWALTLQ